MSGLTVSHGKEKQKAEVHQINPQCFYNYRQMHNVIMYHKTERLRKNEKRFNTHA